MKQLLDIRNFLHHWRVQMRFGRLSREPLQLLRFELMGDALNCDWLARSPDKWDRDLPHHLTENLAASQALEDALAVRDLLFFTIPGLSSACLRVYRHVQDQPSELIITGNVSKPDPVRWVQSVVMHAKLSGFQFSLNEGRLEALQPGV